MKVNFPTTIALTKYAWVWHIAFWILFAGISVNVMSQLMGLDKVIQRVGVATFFLAVFSYSNYYVLLPRFLLRKQNSWFLVLVATLLLVLVPLQALMEAWLGITGIFAKSTSFSAYRLGRILLSHLVFLVITMAVWLLEEWFRKLKLETEMRQYKLEAELKWLKSQINPHFLFNTLNNIYSLVYLKSDHAAPLLLKLSGMLRYMLYECDAPRVSITKEVAYLQDCIDLQLIRPEDRKRVSFEIENHAPDLLIEPMLFISFLENSFKHGSPNSANGWIKIQLRISSDCIDFRIANSILSRNEKKDKVGGIGIANVKQRLELLYPGRHSLSISPGENSFSVHLTLQLHP